MKKLIILLFSVLIYFTTQKTIQAQPVMGGEITWECLMSGQYIFTVKLYRDCAYINLPNSVTLSSNSPVGNIPMTLVNGWPKEITQICNQNPNFTHITCANVTQSNYGAVEEYLYKSAPVILNGVPPASGWEFNFQTCCRFPSSNIIGQPSLKFRAKMYPYNNQNTYPCFDSSPEFLFAASPALNTNNPSSIIYFATDSELDSLIYELDSALQSYYSAVIYASNYSGVSPLPGPFINPNNIPATLNPKTGILEFTSYTPGSFVINTKVTAYKCGTKVAELWRDFPTFLNANNIAGNINNAPNLEFDYGAYNHNDTIRVYSGDSVELNISATDFDNLSTSPFIPTTLTMDVYSNYRVIGEYIPAGPTNPASMSTTTGCLNPPCAIFDPPLSIENPLVNDSTLMTKLKWQTWCETPYTNIGCGTPYNIFDFVFRVKDDYCPVPTYSTKRISIEIIYKPVIQAPKDLCIINNNDSITLIWNKVTDSLDNFAFYKVYKHDNGQDIIIDSTSSINDTTLTIASNNANQKATYKVGTVSKHTHRHCDSLIMGEKTLPIFLKAYQISGNKTMLNWNAPLSTLPANYTDYYVYKSTSANNWSLITTTSNTSFMDTLSHNIDSVKYRVEISNSVCTSISNEARILPSGIEESDLSEKIKIYPNPAKEFLKLEWEEDLQIDLVEIYNTSSQLIFKKEFSPVDRSSTLELNDISKGVYIVILKGEGINYLEKVLVE